VKSIRTLVLGALLTISLYGCSPLHGGQAQKNILFQVSTIGALLEGVYDGNITYREVMKHGDFGLGTFDQLDGEMVAVDGKAYQIKADGRAYAVDGAMKTPFAAVTFFDPDRTVHVQESVDCQRLQDHIDTMLPTHNLFYAIKIEGSFQYVKARSVPQQKKPYPPLAKVTENEVIFEFHNTKGTMAGFRFPAYMEHLNVPGYHFHFINAERRAGGHVHECRVENVRIGIDDLSRFHMALPDHGEFYRVDVK
jgi:acetolactate decarboxylase